MRRPLRILTRRPLLPRGVRLGLALALAAGAVAAAALSQLAPARGGAAVAEAAPSDEMGRRLFLQGCSSCHGTDARGIPGVAPTLRGVGELSADFYLRTGRMPLDRPTQEPVRADPPYTPEQIEALVEYVGGFGGPGIPDPSPEQGDLAEGQKLFTEHCSGCHQVVGRGGIVPGAVVPDLGAAGAVDVAEAIEIGPYVMPRFHHLRGGEVDSIARYVEYTHDPEDRGGWGLGHLGPIPEGMVAWLLAGAALLLAIRLIGERTTR